MKTKSASQYTTNVIPCPITIKPRPFLSPPGSQRINESSQGCLTTALYNSLFTSPTNCTASGIISLLLSGGNVRRSFIGLLEIVVPFELSVKLKERGRKNVRGTLHQLVLHDHHLCHHTQYIQSHSPGQEEIPQFEHFGQRWGRC